MVTAAALVVWSPAPPAFAQSFPNDPASAGNCPTAATPKTPGDGPGGNVFASHIGAPQPLDAPNDEVATYPDIQTITPDPYPVGGITPDAMQYSPFPFSGSINNPVLSQSNAPEATGRPAGC